MKNALAAMAVAVCFALPVWAGVDLNSATQAELESLSGIGPVKARAIITYREKHGPFKSVDELVKVKGIGPATVSKLRAEVEVKSPQTADKRRN